MPDLPAIPARESPYTGGLDVNDGASSTTNIPFIQQAPRGDARNWLRALVRIVKPSAGRKEILTTDRDLQTGPGPQMIVRQDSHKLGGASGPRGMATFPAFAGEAYIPGQNINRRDAGKAVPPLRTIDDAAYIPAVYAGNPSEG